MKKIRIIHRPTSPEALASINNEWRYLEIPINEPLIQKEIARTRDLTEKLPDGYDVLTIDAIGALQAADRKAALAYWILHPNTVLRFNKSACELIES